MAIPEIRRIINTPNFGDREFGRLKELLAPLSIVTGVTFWGTRVIREVGSNEEISLKVVARRFMAEYIRFESGPADRNAEVIADYLNRLYEKSDRQIVSNWKISNVFTKIMAIFWSLSTTTLTVRRQLEVRSRAPCSPILIWGWPW